MIPIPVADIWRNIQEGLRDWDADTLERIKITTRTAYSKMCERVDFQAYRRMATVTGVTGGVLLASNLVDIIYVEDSDGAIYWPAEKWQVKSMGMPSYLIVPESTTPLIDDDKGLTLNKGATSLSYTLTASHVGEYAQFGEEPGLYLITEQTGTFTPIYNGPGIQRGRLVVRPPHTRKIQFYDAAGDEVAGTFTVAYWVAPETLYEGHQRVMIPNPRSLELAVMIEMIGFHEKQEKTADIYRREFDREWSITQRLNPKTMPAQPPCQAQGKRMSFSRR